MSNPEDNFQSKFNETWRLRAQGKRETVLAIAEKYLGKAREAKDQAGEALFLKLYAQVHSDKGELREALSYYKQIERIYIDLKDEVRQMHTLRHIGDMYRELGEQECAEKCLVQVVDFYRNSPTNDLETANANRVFAIVQEDLKKTALAITHWEKAKALYAKVGIPEGVEECNVHLEKLHQP